MGTISPPSLEQLCLKFICTNIDDLCLQADEIVPDCGCSFQKFVFKYPIFFHEQLADNIMKRLACNGKLTSKTATLFIDPTVCRIRKVSIKDAVVDEAILKLLFRNHRISEVDLSGTDMDISSSVCELLNEVSSSLRSLNLSRTTHIVEFSAVWSLTSLTHLNVSGSSVDDTDLRLICQRFNCLESINISNTDISKSASFGDLKNKLKVLMAYNCPVAWSDPTEFCGFVSLQKLDISRNPENTSGYDFPSHNELLEEMLEDPQAMPQLVYLDVSGTPRIREEPLQVFLSSHPKLQFLGLCNTGPITCYSKSLPSEIKVTGEATEKQIIASLEAYPDRAAYMTTVLRRLFDITKGEQFEGRAQMIELVLSPMKKHSGDSRVLMAATASVFNLVRGRLDGDIHCTLLSKIASLVLSTMHAFSEKNEAQHVHLVLRNCLLILESRIMLSKAKFNYLEAFNLAMDALCRFSSDVEISRVATKLCGSLSCKISLQETHALGTDKNISTLFVIVQEKLSSNQADFTLSMALRTLWNLTDEAPSTSLLLVQKGGLQLALQGIEVFREHPEEPQFVIIKKILGTLNNIAEVQTLRHYLITEEFMAILSSLLDHHSIEFAYFSGGILSNLALSWTDDQTLKSCTKEQMLHKLESAVKSWKCPNETLVAYRSFSPFVQLLHSQMPAVQMWSLWAILHVCSANASRYIPLVVRDGVMEVIHGLLETSCVEDIKELAQRLTVAVRNFEMSLKHGNTL